MKMSRARHAFAVAALVAMALLASMPTLARVRHAWGAGGTVHGAMHAGQSDALPLPADVGEACDYCALLGGMADPATPPSAVLATAQASATGESIAMRAADGPAGSLGARGPPAVRAG